ncbi:hypothetical protein C7999DRAFT_45010 [Corynascus novoguineensis]|uniref:Single-strand DNA deaminase toxin A-like C-terminal domain-containing protein n=1 Tax=Corynascus novoguineensis TaxID=1126955 RepID=A0AAN7CKS5_9PEZI|nr:hypothetical protein C7999DRAFT_45010 [Corynascus novoguineensis]
MPQRMVLQVNAEERYTRSGHEHQLYKENTYKRDLDRKAIVPLLEDEPKKSSRESRRLEGYTFTKSPWDENLLTLVAHFDTPNKWKTVGVLYREDQFHTTNKVHRLCGVVGHDLEPHDYDQGEPGRYHSCHAEKQLIAFFVKKHLFLPYETEGDTSLNELSDEEYLNLLGKLKVEELSGEQYEQLQRERDHKKELSDLKKIEPRTSLKKATILVCRRICRDCENFVKRTTLALGLEIIVFHRCLELDCRSCRT